MSGLDAKEIDVIRSLIVALTLRMRAQRILVAFASKDSNASRLTARCSTALDDLQFGKVHRPAMAMLVAVGLLSPWLAGHSAHAQAAPGHRSTASAAPLQSLPSLEVPPYMGTWYQVALFPNRFQKQCVSDTTATYRQRSDGTVEVTNRCRTVEGPMDEAIGLARPTGTLDGSQIKPAQLEVSFLPAWLRWLPVGWGRYWVIQLADDGRYAVISEPSREYLWILSRKPALAPADEAVIRARLRQQGFDLAALTMHAHRLASPSVPSEPASKP